MQVHREREREKERERERERDGDREGERERWRERGRERWNKVGTNRLEKHFPNYPIVTHSLYYLYHFITITQNYIIIK